MGKRGFVSANREDSERMPEGTPIFEKVLAEHAGAWWLDQQIAKAFPDIWNQS